MSSFFRQAGKRLLKPVAANPSPSSSSTPSASLSSPFPSSSISSLSCSPRSLLSQIGSRSRLSTSTASSFLRPSIISPSSSPSTATSSSPSSRSVDSICFNTSHPPSLVSSLRSYPPTRVTTLPNGLRVASETGSGETATVGVWIDTGSRYETESNNGVAHFLEHMTFKGTARRSRKDLELEVENIGGHLNAYTSREQTVYYAKVFKQDVSQAVDILADILQNSKIDEADIDRERDTIKREAREVDSQLEEVIFDRLHQTAYRNSALGRTILGSDDNVSSITKQDIKSYVATHYTANRMVIAGAGAVDHDQLVQLASKLFGSVPSAPPAGKEPYLEPASFTGSDILIRYDDMPLAHVAIAFPTAGWTDADNFPLMLIQAMLGGWEKSVHGGMHSSSRLVSNVAKWELANSVSTFNTQYSDTGLFGVYAVAEPTTLNNLSWAIMDAITSLCYGVDANRLAEAKNSLKMNLLSHLDGSTVICEDIGRQLLTYGRRIHPTEVLARIEAVDAAAIKQTATRYFFDRDHALAAIGPIYELPDYNFFRSRSYFMRL